MREIFMSEIFFPFCIFGLLCSKKGRKRAGHRGREREVCVCVCFSEWVSECLIDLCMYIFAFDPKECQHLTSKERRVFIKVNTAYYFYWLKNCDNKTVKWFEAIYFTAGNRLLVEIHNSSLLEPPNIEWPLNQSNPTSPVFYHEFFIT